MQPSSAGVHTTLHYPLLQIAAHLSCLLPSLQLSALLRRVSVMPRLDTASDASTLRRFDASQTGQRRGPF